MEMMLDKKQIWAIFFFKFKMGHKAMETTHNINKAFGPETDNEYIVWWWFKTFCKGDESLEDEHNGWPSEVHSDHFKTIIEAVPLKLPWEVAEEFKCWSFYGCLTFEANWKGSISGYLMSWPQIKKIVILNHHLFMCSNTEPSLDCLVTCVEKWIYTTTNNDQLSGGTEKKLQSTSQSQTYTRKRSWSLVACCQSDPLQLSESSGNHYIWEVCSANQWDALKSASPAAGIG